MVADRATRRTYNPGATQSLSLCLRAHFLAHVLALQGFVDGIVKRAHVVLLRGRVPSAPGGRLWNQEQASDGPAIFERGVGCGGFC
jgi:hypothetical protein